MVSGVFMGIAYLVGGIPPLLPYIFLRPLTRALIMSVIVAVFVMGMIGFFRWFLNKGSFGGKVAETKTIGLLAAAVGFVAGEALRFFGITNVSI